MYKFKGRGLLQTTGRNMANPLGSFNLSPQATVSINGGYTGLSHSQLNAINTITLGNISSATMNDWAFQSSNPHVKKYEVIESTEDLIACAVAAHRIMKESSIHYKLLDSGLFEKIKHEDRDVAQEIKDYYSKRIMMTKLKSSRQLSSFREGMNKLIHSDCLTFREDMIGIAYWLPEFYKYDTQMDEVKTHVATNQNFEQLNKDGKPNSLKLSVELEPLKQLTRRTKRTKTVEYWLKDTKMDAAVSIILEEKNQLQHLWDYLFTNEKVLKIKGNYIRRSLDDFEYFSVNGWELDRG